jgi:SAM-dependent methyltransferase
VSWIQKLGLRRWLKPSVNQIESTNDMSVETQSTQRPSNLNPAIKYIDNLTDLDAELLEVDKAFAISDEEGRRRLAGFEYVFKDHFPTDPYSTEYAAAQRQVYYALTGRNSYSPDTGEYVEFDFEQVMREPFPYSTRSPSVVGEQLIAQGFLIRAMNLPPAAKIVEFGPGWGNTTLHLAQMGYRVTAVEVGKNFVELISQRARALGVEVELVNQDMATFQAAEQYDACLFFESFHHCADHLGLLRNLHAMTTRDGLIAFAAEPVADFPFPWGFVRTDGLTLWSIRRHGWYELGFDTSYFFRTLLLYGWLPERQTSDVAHSADVIIARKSLGHYNLAELNLPPDEAMTWATPDPEHRFTTARSVMSCSRHSPVREIEFCLSNFAPHELEITLKAGAASRQLKLPAHCSKTIVRLEPEGWQGQVTINSQTWIPAEVYGTDDRRSLGVGVHWLNLRHAPS